MDKKNSKNSKSEIPGSVVPVARGLELRQSSEEERCRIIVNQATAGVAQVDLDGGFTFVNQTFCDLVGYTESELLAMRMQDLTHPDYVEHNEKLFALMRRNGTPFQIEKRFVRKDGSTVWTHNNVSIVPDADGSPQSSIAVVFNISERKEQEIKLREYAASVSQQARIFDTTLSAIADFAYSFDRDARFIYANQPLLDLLGIAPDEIKGKNFFELPYPPELAAKLDGQVRQVFSTKKAIIDETPYTNPTGISGCYEYIFSPVISPDGASVEVVAGSTREITERKQMEEAVRAAAEFNSVVLSSLAAHIAVLDKDGNISVVNEAWQRFARENGGETVLERSGIGVNYLQVCRDADDSCIDDAAQALAGIESVLQGELPEFALEYPCRSSVGQQWFLLNVTPLRGGSGGAAVSHLDITTRRLAEAALRESEERQRLLIESAKDYAIFTLTETGLVDSWNSGAERIFGFTEQEILGHDGAILFTPEDRRSGIPEHELKIAAEQGRAEDERWHIRKDGTRFYASGVMMRLHSGGGFAKIARDMTDQILAEKAGRDKEILRRLVAAQEDERKRIARDLHDHLGQQLTTLRMKLEAVRKLCDGDENHAICGKIDEIQTIAHSVDSDVDFLAWELRPAALDDLGLVAALENYVKEWSRHSGVTAEFHHADLKQMRLAPEVETNLYRIAQEALNNTFKHAKAKHVGVMLERRDDLILLIVEDDGIGFDPDDEQVKKSGIGLLGMQERAALVGGTKEIESEPGKGTTIFVRVNTDKN